MKLGLGGDRYALRAIGRPERNVPSVLVGGTNGKGSTAATLFGASAKACGLRAGLYTSPHLIHVTERIRVEDEDVTGEELDRALERDVRGRGRGPCSCRDVFRSRDRGGVRSSSPTAGSTWRSWRSAWAGDSTRRMSLRRFSPP